MLDIHQFAATVQPGTQFRYHPTDPHEMPRPSYLLTACGVHPCADGQCIDFEYPPDFTAEHGFETGAFCTAVVSDSDRFEIAAEL